MTRLLVSVRSVAEAARAVQGGADFIDLKEPSEGALGGLPISTIAAVVNALRAQGVTLPISATIGDLPMRDLDRVMQQVEAVGACGVTYVKVGIERVPEAAAVLDALAAAGRAVVPVFIADRGLDAGHLAQACRLGFPGLMVDTADKAAGSVFDVMTVEALRRFIAEARAAGALAGIAGALRLAHLPQVRALAPDFAGFRSAVCVQDRRGELDLDRLRCLVVAMRGAQSQTPTGQRADTPG
jgi:(5-formylfuran-3-yl)methyl phosphate synthase